MPAKSQLSRTLRTPIAPWQPQTRALIWEETPERPGFGSLEPQRQVVSNEIGADYQLPHSKALHLKN